MSGISLSTRPDAFIWAGGIEDTFVPQTRKGQRALDEYQLIGHYEHWREDLALTRELGLGALRWGVPWYRVEPRPGEFDWRWIDEVLPRLVEVLGVTPIIDLMHYGCPLWLHKEFANDDYPRAVARYAAEFARRYRGLVRWYTPLNEPVINALMCGKRGLWPPYLRGDGGYLRVMLQLAKGIVHTVEAIKEIDPQAVMVHVEATGMTRTAREDLAALALEDQRRGYICYDLLTGRVTQDHPLFPWLVRNGVSPDDLADLVRRPLRLDVLGMNFYPQWSTKQLFVDQKGRLAYRNVEQDGRGFATLIEDYYRRYQVPIIITETSAFGSDDVRGRWLEASVEAIKNLRRQGVPVVGYTWFPLFTMIDWRYRFGRRPVEQYRLELGLYRLGDGGQGRWITTSLVEQLRGYISHPAEAVGHCDALTTGTVCETLP
jgi:beta-glucosidase/6-phospho-beta-glucosidase/beta-galactosidase